MIVLDTFNDGSYTQSINLDDKLLLLKFDYNERLDQWVLTATCNGITVVGSKALTPNGILSLINLDLNINTTISVFAPKPTSTPISLWSGFYFIIIG